MLNLDQCVGAGRPLIFVCCESDIEVLRYLDTKYNRNNYKVYSTTIAQCVNLKDLLAKKFDIEGGRSKSTIEVLSEIQSKKFNETSNHFETYVFLDCASYIRDPQNVRKIKDILSRYQLDPDFTVSLIFISNNVCVPPALERLSEVVFFDLPGEPALQEMSETLVKNIGMRDDQKPTEEVVNNLRGLTLFEAEQAYLQSWHLYKKIDIDFIREFKKSSLAKTDLLSLLETDIRFDHVGGLETLKKWIRKSAGGWTIEGRKFGLPLLRGLLLVGLPGCGKSLACKAIGNEWKLPVIQFDPSRVFSSQVGESETNIRRVLKIVENTAPCILFIDEIEKGFAGSQSSTFSDSGVTARVIGSFLVWMQECKKPVFTIATSNNIQYLPPELISRFDETFFVNLPQTAEREKIFEIHLKHLNRDPSKFDLAKLGLEAKDLSGREIEQALNESMYDAYAIKSELTTEIISKVLVNKTNLLTTMAEQLKYLLDWVGWDPEKKNGVRARFAHPIEEDNVLRVRQQIDSLISDLEKPKSSEA